MIPRKRPEVGDLWIMELDKVDKEVLVYLVEDLSDDFEEPTFLTHIGRSEHVLNTNPIEKAMTETMILERCYQPRE